MRNLFFNDANRAAASIKRLNELLFFSVKASERRFIRDLNINSFIIYSLRLSDGDAANAVFRVH